MTYIVVKNPPNITGPAWHLTAHPYPTTLQRHIESLIAGGCTHVITGDSPDEAITTLISALTAPGAKDPIHEATTVTPE